MTDKNTRLQMPPDHCKRCNIPAVDTVMTMSFFNTDFICLRCESIEKKHPDYPKAKAIEEKHVKAGNYNFEGIGLPDDWASHVEEMGILAERARLIANEQAKENKDQEAKQADEITN